MDEQDPFSKAGKWKVPGRNPEPEPDITRPMPAPDSEDVTRVRPTLPADDETRVRPAQPQPDDVTRAVPALPPEQVTRIESENRAPPAELTHVAEPVDPLAPAAPHQSPGRLSWPSLAGIVALIAIALYLIFGR